MVSKESLGLGLENFGLKKSLGIGLDENFWSRHSVLLYRVLLLVGEIELEGGWVLRGQGACKQSDSRSAL